MRITHNISAINTYRQLTANTNATSSSLEKLSSGLRVNRAGDDAAGLAISEKMRGQIRGLDKAGENTSNGINMIQTAEGALIETHDILQRMRELAVQSANDTNAAADRAEVQKEIDRLTTEITMISDITHYNTKYLINGSMQAEASTAAAGIESVSMSPGAILESGKYDVTISNYTAGSDDYDVFVTKDGAAVAHSNFTFKFDNTFSNSSFEVSVDASNALIFHIGANSGQNTMLSINNMDAASMGVDKLNLTTQKGSDAAITTIDKAITFVSAQRTALGAMQNRLEHTLSNLSTSSENLTASESQIRDVDMAKEMMNYTRDNILTQASQAMLAQANQQPRSVLQLLRA